MKNLLRLGRVLSVLVLLFRATLPGAWAGTIVVGADEGGPPRVKVFAAPGNKEAQSFLAYAADFSGGVRVAVGDVTGDGKPDVIAGAGPGAGPHVKVFDGATGAEVRSFFAYDPGFSGGVFVAAGDVNGDGVAEIITGTDANAPGHVKVFNGVNLNELASFLPYGGAFKGGVRVAVGDVNGDGVPDIITGAASATSHVKAFHGRTQSELASFFAYTPTFAGGVYVAAGDVNGDGAADIITGAGPGGGPHVKVFSGSTGAELRSFFAYESGFKGGVRVAVGDVDGDGRADLMTSPGLGRGSQIKAFGGRSGALLSSFFAFDPSFMGGVFVGSVSPPPIYATTDPATAVTVATATLNGSVNPNGRMATMKFQYGLTTSYGATVAADPAQVSGATATDVSADIAGLQPDKLYHFRVVASDGLGGTVTGNDRAFFTTVKKPPTGGNFAITPASPVGAGTVLTSVFSGWTDEESNLPLTYEVREGLTVIVPANQNATSKFILPVGTHLLTGRVSTSLGVLTETAQIEVEVEGDPDSEVFAASGEPVSGAGSGGIPEGAVWTSFGVPAMADGSVKFLGAHSSSLGRGEGIFSNWTPVALTGGTVPGAGESGGFSIPAGAVFKRFKDPVTDAAGHVAFMATMGGPGVTAGNDTVVLSDGQTRSPEVLAREGSAAPGANGAKFSAFLGLSVAGPGGTMFTARLGGAVGPGNNRGAWGRSSQSSLVTILTRAGNQGQKPGETIKSFALHQSWPGTPGHGRGQINDQNALLQVSFSSGRQAQALVTANGLSYIASTGDAIDQSSVWVRMAQPASSEDGQFLSVRGTTLPGSASLDSRPGIGILKSTDGGQTWQSLASVGELAAGTDAIWIDLGYPVNSPTGGAMAFLGKIRGGTVKVSSDSGVWWKHESGPVGLLAQEGKQAVGCASGEYFAQFLSLAHPGGANGPIFVAKLAGRSVNAGNDVGVWAVDSSGGLRLLFREGQQIGTRRLLSFTVLSDVSGSPGVTRAFNGDGEVAWRATFTDKATGVVVTQIH